MSIPNVTLNTAILGAYGYTLYKVYYETLRSSNDQSKTTRNEVNFFSQSTVDNIDSELPLETEIKMRPLLGNKRIDLCDAKHSKLSLESATVKMLSSKKILINPDFYKTDPESCKFVVRKKINQYQLRYDSLFRILVIGSVAQVATSALSIYGSWPVFPSIGLSFLVGVTVYSAASIAIDETSNDEAIQQSSDEELVGGQCFFKALEELHSADQFKSNTKEINRCIREIDRLIRVRCICVDLEIQKEKTTRLKAYLEPYLQK